MTFKIVEVTLPEEKRDAVIAMAERSDVSDLRLAPDLQDGRCVIRLLVGEIDRQQLLDRLQFVLRSAENWQITMTTLDTAIFPEDENEEEEAEEVEEFEKKREKARARASREELYNTVRRGAQMDSNFFLLALLSTLVAAIGLMQDNVAVVIGAMVIAPLLGPNLAFAFAAAVGDRKLMLSATLTNLAGVTLSIAVAAAIARLLPPDMKSQELMGRTALGYDGIALALASGAAAALSLTNGLSSTLVGVMVAVALLPPAATLGMMLAVGRFDLAMGAGMLLAANVACVNLSAQVVFFAKGLRPLKWFERKNARQAVILNLLGWLVLLAVVAAMIALKGRI